ncbi:MAG: peptidylprolyl isomerase [Myxococcota bacterium]|nr:peptidylprolyl isomerase [Myxococcota bacterium]MEC9391674.1 peptidylprolyl isomerase [Myxococcota bacterium]
MDTIIDGAVALIHYTLTNDQGEVLDSSDGGDPLPYLHGARNIVPGLEKELIGMKVGESKKVDVAPEEGYGVVNPAMIQTVARAQFPPEADVEPGVQFLMQGDNGQSMPIWVTKVENGMVTIDANHPLAGQTLHFAVTIAGVREATSCETGCGYPHGLTGEETNN